MLFSYFFNCCKRIIVEFFIEDDHFKVKSFSLVLSEDVGQSDHNKLHKYGRFGLPKLDFIV